VLSRYRIRIPKGRSRPNKRAAEPNEEEEEVLSRYRQKPTSCTEGKKKNITVLPLVLYGCETWSLTLREEHRLRIFGPKRDEVEKTE
jgi:hypothetical protein